MSSQIVPFIPVSGAYVQCKHRHLHRLVRQSLQRWARDRSLSFVPPDGRFTLAEYRYAPKNTSIRLVGPSTPSMPVMNVVKDIVPLPFTVKASVELEDHGGIYSLVYVMGYTFTCSAGAFDITFTSRLTTRAIESLVAEMHLGEGAGGLKCIAAQGSETSRFGRGMGGLESGPVGVIGASWSFDSNKKVCTQRRICQDSVKPHMSPRYCDGRSPPSLPQAAGISVGHSLLLRKSYLSPANTPGPVAHG